MQQLQLPPNPALKSVDKICRENKEIDFQLFFDSNKSGLYITVRHRYNQLIYIVADGISHLKLFTKHLKTIIEAQQASADSTLANVEQYRQEEPTFQSMGFTRMVDEAAVTLPTHLQQEEKTDVTESHRKTDIDAFTDIFGFERNMAKLFALYWKRLNSEIFQPLNQYRKIAIKKLESVQENVSQKYDKLIKSGTKLHTLKLSAIEQWNELCDARHSLRKLRANAPDSNKTKKQVSKVKNLENKCTKLFENVVQLTDKYNNQQDEFWNEVVKDACLQLESIEYTRICFYQEYFDKYHELLQWRRAELENGENTLARARKMMMTPFEIAEYGIHPIRIDFGNYNPIQPQQYELPCMPSELSKLTGKITEQRIDPGILSEVFNPFGDEIRPSTSKHKKTNYSRTSISSFNGGHDSTRSVSSSISSVSSISHIGGIGGGVFDAKSYMASQPANSFFADNTKNALFARSNKNVTHNGGLPPAPTSPDSNSYSSDSAKSNQTFVSHDGKSPPGSAPSSPGKSPMKPPRKLPPTKVSIATDKPPNKRPPLPNRSPTSPNKRALPKRAPNGNTSPAPQLPPRRKTIGDQQPPSGTFRPPPKKSAIGVAERVRKSSFDPPSNTNTNKKSRAFNQRQPPKPSGTAPSPPADTKKKKKSKWFGK